MSPRSLRVSGNGNDLADAAGPPRQHHDAVGDPHRFLEIMRDIDRAHRAIGEQADKILHQQFAGLRIQRRQRLVHQQDRGPHRQRARDADALAHAAGQLLGIGAAEIRQAGAAQRVVDHRAALARRQGRRAAAEIRHSPPPCTTAAAQNPGTRRSAGCGCPAAARRAIPPRRRSAAAARPGSTAACSCRSRRDRRSRPPRPRAP